MPTTSFGELADAWNRADGPAFGELFADDTDFVDIRGEHHRGDGVLVGRAHQAIFDTIDAGSSVSYRVDVARGLSAACVLVVVTSTFDAPGGPLSGIHHSRITAVLTEHGDRWLITAFHNTLVAS